MRENMDGYIRGLGAFQGPAYDNSYIGRLHYRRFQPAGPETRFTARCRRQRKNYQQLLVEGWERGEQVGWLQAELLFFAQKVNHSEKIGLQKAEDGSLEGYTPWRSFSSEELRAFARVTGDTNPIHLGVVPVVQGLLLWRSLFEQLGEPERFHMAFYVPVHAGNMIYIREEEKNERNEREFASICGRSDRPAGTGTGDDGQCGLCRAAGRLGVHFFSAAFHTRHGDGADHRRESGRLHHEA